MSGDPSLLADRPANVVLSGPEPLGAGFRPYERFRAEIVHADGSRDVQERDILRGGEVVGVLAVDPVRDLVVLIRQFRVPAQLATGRGEMVEIVAGRVEPGEAPEHAAARECVEEIGLAPSALRPLFRFLPTPGVTDECATLFLARVDAGGLPQQAGAADEGEVTLPFAVPVTAALAALDTGAMANGYVLIALQWLALNRARLGALLA